MMPCEQECKKGLGKGLPGMLRHWYRKLVVVVALLTLGLTFAVWKGDCSLCHSLISVPINVDVVVPPFSVPPHDVRDDVILSAYMNSGSRFTGRLLGFLPNTFYFYEPLWQFSVWDYFRPPDVRCSTTSGVCKTVTTKALNSHEVKTATKTFTEPIMKNTSTSFRPIELLVNVMSRVFSCDLVSLQTVVQDRVHDHASYAGPSWEQYRWCIQAFNPKSKCLRELENTCRERRRRVTKTLRVTVGAFRPLLAINPRLKIVHLVRDPRAIIHSRRYSRFFPVGRTEKDTAAMAKSLCDKMEQDISDAVTLMEEFPDRVVVVYYEDLFENLPIRLKQLYRFLNVNYDSRVVNTLSEVKTNLSPPQLGVGFFKDRERNNTAWWRRYMTWSDVQIVDSECGCVIRTLGYTRYRSNDQLQDTASHRAYTIPDGFTLPRQP